MLNGPRTLPNTFTTASTTAWCSAGTSDLPVIGATRGMMGSSLETAVGLAARLAAASVATADEAQVIAEMRFQAGCPVAFPRLLPLGRLLHLGRGEVVERHVFAAAAAATETTGAQDSRDGAERRDVLLVVPLVELGLEFGRDVHRVQQEPAGIGGRELVARQDLIAFEPQQTLDPTVTRLSHGDRFAPPIARLAGLFITLTLSRSSVATETVRSDAPI